MKLHDYLVYTQLLLMTILGAFGGFYLKKATGLSSIWLILRSPWFYLGGILYFSSALINIYVLKYLLYSTVLPLTSITYIWSFILSYKFLSEKITRYKWTGIIFIILGAIFISL
ncbi:4-amino-4-deoxy-L-arabinose-phosphoundecaprenol flippase subunit ArnE [Pelotomaculum sp. FP]|nr:4-amino-4-deoxy-L-arabinose-phosphoundecaprenol flippase subunit ArnE [Pelotomaculum sp. FP]